MLILITGTPGAGKTQYAIAEYLLKEGKGRPLYSNIKGLRVDGVKPAPDDWRETPEGSMVVYDEAQDDHLFPSSGKPGVSQDERVRAMEKHRHTGHDLIFITQHPTLIDAHIRKLIGRHHHLNRPGNMHRIGLYTADSVMDVTDKGLKGKSAEIWKHDKKVWDLYDSTTVDTHNKIRIPKRIIAIFTLILLGMFLAAWLFWGRIETVSNLVDGKGIEGMQSQEQATPFNPLPGTPGKAPSLLTDPTMTPHPAYAAVAVEASLGGCISTSKRCVCYLADGTLAQVDERTCRNTVREPLPVTAVLGEQWKSEQEDKGSSHLAGGEGQEPFYDPREYVVQTGTGSLYSMR